MNKNQTKTGETFAFDEWHPLPAPEGIVPTALLVCGSPMPATATFPIPDEATHWMISERMTPSEGLIADLNDPVPAKENASEEGQFAWEHKAIELMPPGGFSERERKFWDDRQLSEK